MFRKIGLLGTALFILAVASDYAMSAPPLKWEWRQRYPNVAATEKAMDYDTRSRLRAQCSIGMAEKYGAISVSSPVIKILVVRVQFPDQSFLNIALSYAQDFFQKLSNFYLENSYGKLTIQTTVSGSIYTLPHNMGYYGSDATNGPPNLLSDTIAASSSTLSYAGYDAVMIMHAGNGQEMTGLTNDIWSQWDSGSYTVSGNKFTLGYTLVPEKTPLATQSPLGVICHETGHQLGLPDLYNTSSGGEAVSLAGTSSVIGAWSLMDWPYGVDGNGVNPPHLDAWSKNDLGFLNFSSRALSATTSGLTWSYVETSSTTSFYKITIAVAPATEYFVAEMRSTTAGTYDHQAPGSGVVIWHIDEAIAQDPTRRNINNNINSGIPHLAVGLVVANGSFSVPGHASDAFTQGCTFVSPLSNSFSGLESGIALTGFSFSSIGAGGSLAEIAANPSLGIVKLINYPNPAGAGYPHPRSASGVLTTIVMKASRPAQRLELAVYNIAGEKVKSADKTQIGLLADKSKDYNWFYQYDWDGKNDNGEDVAPGVYFYRIKADSETSVGKLAIVR